MHCQRAARLLLSKQRLPLTYSFRLGLLQQRNLHFSTGLEYPSAPSPTSSLLSYLEQRLGERKDGLGYSPWSPAIATSRRALLDAIRPAAELSPEALATNVCAHYRSLENSVARRNFLLVLAGDLSVDHEGAVTGAQRLADLHSQGRGVATLLKSEAQLRQLLQPPYCQLFSLIGRLEGGVKFLVDLRGDLLDALRQHPEQPAHLLAEMGAQLRELLAEWFSLGLLDVQKLTWESPCDILEKISQHEAVHPLRHWRDLKHRVGPGRRCFIFTHPALPREPIMVLHAALTSGPASSIQALLSRKSSTDEDSEDIDTAVFYSISATQRGLSGIELGNCLIRRVARELQHEFPEKLKHFVTLSPIPGFRKWLESHLKLHIQQGPDGCRIRKEELNEFLQLLPGNDGHLQTLQVALSNNRWAADPNGELAQALREPLLSLCARYLTQEKRRGRALDPVAHFHLQNGASMWRLNWLADTSPSGLQRSLGLMVNYRYHLPTVDSNSDSYRIHGTVALSNSVKPYL